MNEVKINKALANRRRPARNLWALNKTLVVTLASVAIVVGYFAFLNTWHSIYSTASSLDVWLIISITTFTVVTGIVMTGRFLERRLAIDANLRSQKIDLYDDLLKDLSKLFQREHNNSDLIAFINTWQSKLLLWSEGETLNALFRWHHSLMAPNGHDHSLLMLDDFIRALREEIGHPTNHIEQGAFIHLMIDHAAFLHDHSHSSPEKPFAH